MTSRIRWALGLAIAVIGVSCAGSPAGPDDPAGSASADGAGPVVVFAAASLADAFAALELAFEAAHPEIDIERNIAGSSALREQILEGAPADVFASADPSNMATVTEAGLAPSPAIFASNTLEIAVPAGNPAGVTSLADFARDDLLIGLCAAEVPCGAFARLTLEAAGVDPAIDTNEPDVRALTTKVAAGELDAGIVYVTDVLAAGDAVEGIEIEPAVNQRADYPIAVLRDAPNPTGAEDFVAFVSSSEGQAVLAIYGFIPYSP